MMKLFRIQSLKLKASKKNNTNGSSDMKQKKRKKRKSIVFKPKKRAKLDDNCKDNISEVSVCLNEQKTIISRGISDFDQSEINDSHEGLMETGSPYSSHFLEVISNSSDNEDVDGIKVENGGCSENKDSFLSDSNDSIECTLDELIEKSQADGELDSDSASSDFEIHEFETDYVVILKYSQTIRILGYCDVKVLHGKINILGYMLNRFSKTQSIYSPKGSALLSLENTSNYCDEICKMKNLVPKLSQHPKLKDLELRKDCAILLFLKNQNNMVNFVEKHISQWIFPNKTCLPCVEINPKGCWNVISIPSEWNEVVQNATGQSKMLVCGGKSVGKSTFLRYAVNCLLQKYKAVKVIDLDPGQSEFNVPSTLSVITVSGPLLGVNYTHLKTPDRSILCDINIALDPEKFIKCLQELLIQEVYTENIPTIINTMGFTNEIAFHLISSTIALLEPNQILYIESKSRKKNFKNEMNKKTLIEYAKLFTPNLEFNFSVNIEKIPSASDETVGWTLQSRQMREMCILAYFGQSMTEDVNTLQGYRLPMFKVDLLDVSLTDQNNSNVPPEAVNANIVALCRLANESNATFECFGFGIARYYNPVTKKIILITPTNKDVLEKVTHFVAGGLTLPPSVYMNQDDEVGHVPYIVTSDLKGFDQMLKRSRVPCDAQKKC